MRIMTSNIWGDFFQNPTRLRTDALYRVYQNYTPDVIGFQEAAQGWYDVDLFWKLGENYHLIGTECCNNTNSTPLAVKKEYTVLSYGHEQLERTPDWSKSITWAVLEKAKQRLAVCNTHFWWMRGPVSAQLKEKCHASGYDLQDHNALRAQTAAQLSNLMHALHTRYTCPVFAFGDMNATISEEVFAVYAKNDIRHLFDLAKEKDTTCSIHGDPVRGEDGFFHGKRVTPDYLKRMRAVLELPEDPAAEGYLTSIDHIIALGENFEVSQYRVVEDQDALDATDHSPIYVDLTLG